MSENDQELAVESGDKKLKLRGSDLLTTVIGIVVCSGLVYVATVLIDHKADAKQNGSEVVMAIREMTKAQQDSTQQQRITNCIISLPQERRAEALSTCERIAR